MLEPGNEQYNPQQILDEITSIAMNQEVKLGQLRGEGTHSRVDLATVKSAVQIVQGEGENQRTQNLEELPVIKAVLKPGDAQKENLERQAKAFKLLAEKNVRSPFLEWNLAEVKGERVALQGRMDLREFLRQHNSLPNPLPPLRAIKIIQQIFLGLEKLHDHKIVHRDLKPENIFLYADHNVKIGDLESVELTLSEVGKEGWLDEKVVFTGTPGYFPEKEVAEIKDLGDGTTQVLYTTQTNYFKADLYAVGKIIDDICTVLAESPIKKQLKSLFNHLTNPDPSKRPSINAVKEHLFSIGGIPFPDLQSQYTKEIYSGNYLIGPYSNPGEVFNVLPPHFKDQYHAFQNLIRQYEDLQTYRSPRDIDSINPLLLRPFFSKLYEFLTDFSNPTQPSPAHNPYAAQSKQMIKWVEQQYVLYFNYLQTHHFTDDENLANLHGAISTLGRYAEYLPKTHTQKQFLGTLVDLITKNLKNVPITKLPDLTVLIDCLSCYLLYPENTENKQKAITLAIELSKVAECRHLAHLTLAILKFVPDNEHTPLFAGLLSPNPSWEYPNRADLKIFIETLAGYVEQLDKTNPQKKFLTPYIKLARKDLNTMPGEDLPDLTQLTYHILIDVMDSESVENKAAGAAIAIKIAKKEQGANTSYVGLAVLGVVLIAGAVFTLLPSFGGVDALVEGLKFVKINVTAADIYKAITITKATVIGVGFLAAGFIASRGTSLTEPSKGSRAAQYIIDSQPRENEKTASGPKTLESKTQPDATTNDSLSSRSSSGPIFGGR